MHQGDSQVFQNTCELRTFRLLWQLGQMMSIYYEGGEETEDTFYGDVQCVSGKKITLVCSRIDIKDEFGFQC